MSSVIHVYIFLSDLICQTHWVLYEPSSELGLVGKLFDPLPLAPLALLLFPPLD